MPDVVTSIWSLAVAGLHGERMAGGWGGGSIQEEGRGRGEEAGGGGGKRVHDGRLP